MECRVQKRGILLETQWKCSNGLAPLPLPLLVALVGADDIDDAPAAHDLAVLADLLDRRTNFHV
jgi:hypothetical protein